MTHALEDELFPLFHDKDKLDAKKTEINSFIEQKKDHLLNLVQVEPVIESVADLDEIEANLAIIQQLQTFKTHYDDFETQFNEKNFVAAYDLLDKLKELVSGLPPAYASSLLALDVDNKLKQYEEKLQEKLCTLWNKLVFIKKSENQVSVSITNDADALNLIESRAPHCIQSLKDLVGEIVHRVIDLKIDSIQDDAETLTVVYGTTHSVETVIDVVQTLVLSLDAGLSGCPRIFQQVSKRFGTYLTDNLVHTTLPRLLPSDPEKLDMFEKDVKGLQYLEEFLHSVGWSYVTTLTDFSNDFYSVWQLSRLTEHFGRLRDVLSEPLNFETNDEWEWKSDEETVESSSHSPQDVSDCIDAAFAELSNYDKSLLTRIFALYRALSPAAYRNSPIQLYNHTIEHLNNHKDTLDPGCVEEVFEFANKQLALYSAGVVDEMKKLLLSSPLAPGLAVTLHTKITKFSREMSDAEPSVSQQLLVPVVEQVAHHVCNTIVSLEDISEVHSQQLSSLIRELGSLESLIQDIQTNVPSWHKMERLSSILTGSLSEIERMYRSSELLDFSDAELEGLLLALFQDSERRQEVLDLVRYG